MNQSEATWFEKTRDAYLMQTRFTEVTDEQDIDRLLRLELMDFRYGQFNSSGLDYDNDEVDTAKLTAEMRALSKEINALKAAMGLAKSARDAAANDGDFAKWFEEAKRSAKAFNFHRVEQLGLVLTLFNEFASIVATYDRSDEEERQMAGYTSETEVLDWWRNSGKPRFDELDEYFKVNKQATWIRKI